MKILSWGISIIFHPLILLTYVLILLLLLNPYDFGVADIMDKDDLILQIFLITFFMPAFLVFMLKALGFTDSYDLKESKQRVTPYVFTGLLYMWMYRNFLTNTDIPDVFTNVVLGATISIFVVFFINNFLKISAHAAGMGGLIGMLGLIFYGYDYYYYSIHFANFKIGSFTILLVAILLSGLVGTSRLLLGAHSTKELYLGYIVGFLSQIFVIFYNFSSEIKQYLFLP